MNNYRKLSFSKELTDLVEELGKYSDKKYRLELERQDQTEKITDYEKKSKSEIDKKIIQSLQDQLHETLNNIGIQESKIKTISAEIEQLYNLEFNKYQRSVQLEKFNIQLKNES